VRNGIYVKEAGWHIKMKFSIIHELPGRIRLRCPRNAFTETEALVIGALLETHAEILRAVASHRSGSLLIHYEGERSTILKAVRRLDATVYRNVEGLFFIPEKRDDPVGALLSFLGKAAGRALTPRILRRAQTVIRIFSLLRQESPSGFFSAM
jgi:hypothetical protein